MKGIVYRSTGSWYFIKLENGEFVDARIKGIFRLDNLKTTNPIAVGDKVSLEKGEQNDWIIHEIVDRKNYIIRQSPKHRTARHIIASNIDQLVIIATIAQPRTSSGFIDRCLVTASAYHIPTIIVFNKQDILKEKDRIKQNEWVDMYQKIGYPIFKTSAVELSNIEAFKSVLMGNTTLVAGHSGVGKSSLINLVEPKLLLRTNSISSVHEKGMHTTTFAEMHDLSFGGKLIDTPGIKEFGVLDIEKHELGHFFTEFLPHLVNCKFNNCLHVNEPNCAVLEAVKKGEISLERFNNYINILDDLDEALKFWEVKK